MAKQTQTPRDPPAPLGLQLMMQGGDSIPLIDLWKKHESEAGDKWTAAERIAHAKTFFGAAALTLEALEKNGVLEGRAVKRRTLMAHAQQLAANCIEWAKHPDAKRIPTN